MGLRALGAGLLAAFAGGMDKMASELALYNGGKQRRVSSGTGGNGAMATAQGTRRRLRVSDKGHHGHAAFLKREKRRRQRVAAKRFAIARTTP